MHTKKILGGLVALIGAAMVVAYWGVWPPVLSGIAFILLGIERYL